MSARVISISLIMVGDSPNDLDVKANEAFYSIFGEKCDCHKYECQVCDVCQGLGKVDINLEGSIIRNPANGEWSGHFIATLPGVTDDDQTANLRKPDSPPRDPGIKR